MIEPWVHEIARKRHLDLLAGAERYRLGRSVRDRNTHRRTASYRLTFRLGRAFRMAATQALRQVLSRAALDMRSVRTLLVVPTRLRVDEPRASNAIEAIQSGDIDALSRQLHEQPELATAKIVRRRGTLTLLHVATDWPGHFPNAAKTVAMLLEAGADVNACSEGANSQTPLHWAASSDDVEVLDALLDAGADIEAPGAFNNQGGPLDNAVGFGQWNAARRLVERGARTNLWHAAALGLTERMEGRFAETPPPSPSEITEAFWQACHGDQQEAAEFLAKRGADLNWIGYDDLTPLDTARRSKADRLAEWLSAQGARTAADLNKGR